MEYDHDDDVMHELLQLPFRTIKHGLIALYNAHTCNYSQDIDEFSDTEEITEDQVFAQEFARITGVCYQLGQLEKLLKQLHANHKKALRLMLGDATEAAIAGWSLKVREYPGRSADAELWEEAKRSFPEFIDLEHRYLALKAEFDEAQQPYRPPYQALYVDPIKTRR